MSPEEFFVFFPLPLKFTDSLASLALPLLCSCREGLKPLRWRSHVPQALLAKLPGAENDRLGMTASDFPLHLSFRGIARGGQWCGGRLCSITPTGQWAIYIKGLIDSFLRKGINGIRSWWELKTDTSVCGPLGKDKNRPVEHRETFSS